MISPSDLDQNYRIIFYYSPIFGDDFNADSLIAIQIFLDSFFIIF